LRCILGRLLLFRRCPLQKQARRVGVLTDRLRGVDGHRPLSVHDCLQRRSFSIAMPAPPARCR
jgi:hypothetical protein